MRLRSIVAPLLKWFAENARDLPWRRTRDPYAIWVSEIMLQQTQVKTVIPYWERWMNRLPDVAALANAREDTVIKLWEGLGYYSRVRNMQKAARLIPDEHGGRFPRDLAGVLALPGWGVTPAGQFAASRLTNRNRLWMETSSACSRAWPASKSRPRPSRCSNKSGPSLMTS